MATGAWPYTELYRNITASTNVYVYVLCRGSISANSLLTQQVDLQAIFERENFRQRLQNLLPKSAQHSRLQGSTRRDTA